MEVKRYLTIAASVLFPVGENVFVVHSPRVTLYFAECLILRETAGSRPYLMKSLLLVAVVRHTCMSSISRANTLGRFKKLRYMTSFHI